MTALEQQMIDELIVAQGFTNDLAANLITKGVPSNTSEGLDTLVPKVLEIESGVAKSPYDEWQEGFGYNWDGVVANAPLLHTNRILHVYTEVDFLQMISTFPTTTDIVAYNPETEAYRRLTMSATKLLTLQESDKFTNSHDGLKYVCVIYSNVDWGIQYFRTQLPVVYSNSKAVTGLNLDTYVNLLGESNSGATTYYPFLRGIDCTVIGDINLYNGIEYVAGLTYAGILRVGAIQGGNLQIAVFKKLIDEMPTGTQINILIKGLYITPYLTDEKLANWFYNTFIYNYYSGTEYYIPTSNITRLFKFNSALLLNAGSFYNQIHLIPNAMYLMGTITENQTATTYAGYHGFNLSAYTLLRNFPMWTVLEGANYGCLKPMQTISARGNFDFYSTNLERDYFAKFDEFGELILDPTLSFIANLPVQTVSGANIKFRDSTFKNKFTAGEITKISTLLTSKKWSLTWQI